MRNIIEVERSCEVKGTFVTFLEKVLIDEVTGEEIFDPQLEQENDISLFNKYREMNGLLLPQEIKEIRLELGVTQVEFAKLLGLEYKEVVSYENGSLQDIEQNTLIRSLSKKLKF